MPTKIELEEETQKSLIKIGDPLDMTLWDEVIQGKGDTSIIVHLFILAC